MRKFTAFLTGLLLIVQAFAADSLKFPVKKLKIVKYSIHEEIAPSATRITTRAFAEAEKINADLIILDLNTYGGLVSDADSIRTRILNSKIPVFVFIQNNAASAGALISIAAHRIYMRQGSTIGAASVVGQDGQKVPEKYQSYMRSKMRATAEVRGRNPDIAEAMVDEDVTVDSVNKKGKLITLTTTEAMKLGFCEGEVESVAGMLKMAGIEDYEIVEVQKNWMDNTIGFLMHPGVSGVLVLLIFLGIYYELQAPGIGFPTLIAIGAALMYFAPLYLEGLAANWEILLFVGGLALLMIELFAIPGFGVTGIAGIVLIFISLVLSLVRNVNFDFSGTGEGDLGMAVIRISVSMVAFMVFLFFFGAAFFRSKFFNRLVLSDDLSEARMNTIKQEKETLTGKEGVCFDNLRPQGKVKVGDTIYPATSLGGFIEKGTAVTVIREEAGMLVVRVS